MSNKINKTIESLISLRQLNVNKIIDSKKKEFELDEENVKFSENEISFIANSLHNSGWRTDHIYQYIAASEYVDPYCNENLAIAKMAEISKIYNLSNKE